MSPFISTQLAALGITLYEKEKIQHFENLRTAMMDLYFNSYMSDKQLGTMHSKLMRNIIAHLEEAKKERQSNG